MSLNSFNLGRERKKELILCLETCLFREGIGGCWKISGDSPHWEQMHLGSTLYPNPTHSESARIYVTGERGILQDYRGNA